MATEGHSGGESMPSSGDAAPPTSGAFQGSVPQHATSNQGRGTVAGNRPPREDRKRKVNEISDKAGPTTSKKGKDKAYRDKKKEDIQNVKDESERLQKENGQLKSDLERVTTEKKDAVREAEIWGLKKEHELTVARKDKELSDCKNESLGKELQSANQKVEDITGQLQNANQRVQEISRQLESTHAKLESAYGQLGTVNAQLQSANAQIERLLYGMLTLRPKPCQSQFPSTLQHSKTFLRPNSCRGFQCRDIFSCSNTSSAKLRLSYMLFLYETIMSTATLSITAYISSGNSILGGVTFLNSISFKPRFTTSGNKKLLSSRTLTNTEVNRTLTIPIEMSGITSSHQRVLSSISSSNIPFFKNTTTEMDAGRKLSVRRAISPSHLPFSFSQMSILENYLEPLNRNMHNLDVSVVSAWSGRKSPCSWDIRNPVIFGKKSCMVSFLYPALYYETDMNPAMINGPNGTVEQGELLWWEVPIISQENLLMKEERTLQRKEENAAEERTEINRMIEEVTEMVEAMEVKEAEPTGAKGTAGKRREPLKEHRKKLNFKVPTISQENRIKTLHPMQPEQGQVDVYSPEKALHRMEKTRILQLDAAVQVRMRAEISLLREELAEMEAAAEAKRNELEFLKTQRDRLGAELLHLQEAERVLLDILFPLN